MSNPPPATPAPCDICNAEPAAASLMNLATYEQVRVGLACMPEFFRKLAGDTDTAAPAPVPAPGEPAPDAPAPQTLDEDPASGDMAPADVGPPAAASGPPALPAMPAPDLVRQADAETAQLSLLRLMGVAVPDTGRCPQCDTTAYGWPLFNALVCPYCATMFGPGWARLTPHVATAVGNALVPDGPDATMADTRLESEPAGAGGPSDTPDGPGAPDTGPKVPGAGAPPYTPWPEQAPF